MGQQPYWLLSKIPLSITFLSNIVFICTRIYTLKYAIVVPIGYVVIPIYMSVWRPATQPHYLLVYFRRNICFGGMLFVFSGSTVSKNLHSSHHLYVCVKHFQLFVVIRAQWLNVLQLSCIQCTQVDIPYTTGCKRRAMYTSGS